MSQLVLFRTIIFLFFSIVFFGASCERGDRLWTLQYRVEVISGKGNFTAKFLSRSGGEVHEGNIDQSWKSRIYNQVESGTRVRLLIEKKSGNQELQIEILRDGAVHEMGTISSSEKSKEINDSL